MAYTETTSKSWFSRLGSAFKGIAFGIALIIAGTVLLWWNEGSFVATGDALREAQGVTQELGDISRLDASKNGQLVHAAGPVETNDILEDPIFGLSINAIRLERTVEFYQWTEQSQSETKQKLGGGEETVTTYTYSARWTSSPVDSSQFKDPKAREENRNAILAPMQNLKVQATNVTFGAYRLPEFLIGSISGAVPLNANLSEAAIAKLNRELAAVRGVSPPKPSAAAQTAEQELWQIYGGGAATENMESTQAPTQAAPQGAAQMVHVSGNTVFLGASTTTPQIGDVRVSFKETRPGTVSILAKLNGDTFEQYRASNNKTVSQLAMGTHSLENMYGSAHSSNATTTWILRLVGALLVCFGLGMVMAPLSVLVSVIPLLGDIVGAGTGLVSMLLGLAWSLVIISIAWLRFRPVIGIAMLVVAGAFVALLYFKGHARKAAKA